MDTNELASFLQQQWTNGNCDDVIRKLDELDNLVASAVVARMVLLLHNGQDVPTDLSLFTTRLDAEALWRLSA